MKVFSAGNDASSGLRVSQVEYAPKVDSQQILSFYMGKNTPERKDYIMENLVVTVEEERRARNSKIQLPRSSRGDEVAF